MQDTPLVHDDNLDTPLTSDLGAQADVSSRSDLGSDIGLRDPSGQSASVLELGVVAEEDRADDRAGQSHPVDKFGLKFLGNLCGLPAVASLTCLLAVALLVGLAVYLCTRGDVVSGNAATDVTSSVIRPASAHDSVEHVSRKTSSSDNSSSANLSILPAVDWWLSTEDGGALLAQQLPLPWDPSFENASEGEVETIVIRSEERYQEILGIGTSLEATTAFNMARLNHTKIAEVLQALFDPDHGVGFNLARITIGTSDFAPLPFYTYDDLNTSIDCDEDLDQFSIAEDETYVLPLINKALNASQNGSSIDCNDSLLLFASPWSPPSWMKSSRKLQGGHLFPWFRNAYARYLVAFIMAYVERGIHIHALTVQNEPLQNKPSYPTSLLMPVGERAVIRSLGQQLKSANLTTRIWCFDHNWEDLWYPEQVLNDTLAAEFVEGTAFHFYKGRPESMTKLYEAHPDKKIFFTEGSAFGAKGAAKIVEIFRNWASTYMAWVTMLDSELQPNAGPFTPSPSMLLLDKDTLEVEFRFDYYMYGHFSKYIRRGAVRVNSAIADSDGRDSVKHVAFQNQERASGANNGGSLVLVAVNVHERSRRIRIRHGRHVSAVATLPAKAVATFRWHLA